VAATDLPAASSGVFSIGGGLPVTRLGYGVASAQVELTDEQFTALSTMS
jgi:hypothetical protein